MTPPDIVTASLTYQLPPPDGERAYSTVNVDPTTGNRHRNFLQVAFDVPIENIRGKEHTFTLDNAGFQYACRPTHFQDFHDDRKVWDEYYPESEAIIKELTGASRVVFFDHTRRLRRREQELDISPNYRQPVSSVHVDQTTASSIARVHQHLPPTDAPTLLRNRFQIINLWRPIGNSALDWPLALCDYKSVDATQDTFPLALIYPDREAEAMIMKHNPNHKWKYLRSMTPDEIVLIKCFDSLKDGSVALFSPHTGFQDPTTPADAPPRESIELRALVFYD